MNGVDRWELRGGENTWFTLGRLGGCWKVLFSVASCFEIVFYPVGWVKVETKYAMRLVILGLSFPVWTMT